MFEYKTRTETVNGCKFFEQDILLLDYLYHDDCEIECVVDYNAPGFGFVFVEDTGNGAAQSENIYLIKFGKRNQYQIINKQLLEQTIVRDEFILGANDINIPSKDLRFVVKFTENCKLQVFLATKDEYGINIESMIVDYEMPYQMNEYKIGFYSNAGNTLKFAAIQTECPSNWISNVFNGNGGRINWIQNGFEIENCEYDCEVESQGVELEAGIYYFDFKSTNPDIKYYIYLAEQKDTDIKRPLDEILATIEDETKNILDYDTMSFEVQEKEKVNIKFKGKWGRVTEICIKKYKEDSFVETDYDSVKREASYIEFDLSKIKKIELEGTVTAVPNKEMTEKERYSLFLIDSTALNLTDLGIELNTLNKFEFDSESRTLTVNGKENYRLKDTTDNKLIVFKNVDATISKLIITTIAGDEIDVLLQKTFRITVSKNIKTPIIITDLNNNPFDLSGSYREVIEESRVVDIFNKYNIIKLKHRLCLVGNNVIVAGINDGIIDTTKDSLEELGAEYELISPNYYTIDYDNNYIKIDQDTKNKYKYIAIEYNHCNNYHYEFTNYEREIYNLNTQQNIYIENNICDVIGAVVIYGIPKNRKFYPELVYKIPSIQAVNTIDYSAEIYDILLSNSYEIIGNRISLSPGIREKYDYLIIDYLKDNSYCINEREAYYEIDIATSDETVRINYDSDENGVTNTYTEIDLKYINENNFIVLRKE